MIKLPYANHEPVLRIAREGLKIAIEVSTEDEAATVEQAAQNAAGERGVELLTRRTAKWVEVTFKSSAGRKAGPFRIAALALEPGQTMTIDEPVTQSLRVKITKIAASSGRSFQLRKQQLQRIR